MINRCLVLIYILHLPKYQCDFLIPYCCAVNAHGDICIWMIAFVDWLVSISNSSLVISNRRKIEVIASCSFNKTELLTKTKKNSHP
jgi:hypothetical protein